MQLVTDTTIGSCSSALCKVDSLTRKLTASALYTLMVISFWAIRIRFHNVSRPFVLVFGFSCVRCVPVSFDFYAFATSYCLPTNINIGVLACQPRAAPHLVSSSSSGSCAGAKVNSISCTLTNPSNIATSQPKPTPNHDPNTGLHSRGYLWLPPAEHCIF